MSVRDQGNDERDREGDGEGEDLLAPHDAELTPHEFAPNQADRRRSLTHPLPAPKRRKLEEDLTPVHYDFVQEPPDKFVCSICFSVFNNPVIVNGCGHEFCEQCLSMSVSNKRSCPSCRQPVQDTEFFTPLRRVREEIDELAVRCPNKGCNGITKRKDLPDHLATCPLSLVCCAHRAYGCEWSGKRQEQGAHLESCLLEKLHPYVDAVAAQVQELRQEAKELEQVTKRFKTVEGVWRARGERLRRAHSYQLSGNLIQLGEQITIIRVFESMRTQWMFRVKLNAKLGKIISIVRNKRGRAVVLTCDGPLDLDGTVVRPDDTLLLLGVAVSTEPHTAPVLYAEAL